MAVIPIRTLPDPVLRQKCKKVPAMDPSIKKLIDNMLDTMYEANGVGLAAPQIGIPLRIVTICLPDNDAQDIILINPEIIKKNGEREIEERCLSIPGYFGKVKRATTVTAKGRDANWKEVRIKGEGLLAQALEHEIDHLNGTLYVDRVEKPEDVVKIEPQNTNSEGEE
jgi:peptide deformylase